VYINHDFSPRDYEFPRLYIVGERSKEVITLLLERGCYVRGTASGGILAGLVPYESGWNKIFDYLKAEITRSFAVVIPWMDGQALFSREGTRVKLVEVSGIHVNIVSREGDEVDERSVLAYVVTNKGETRTVRAETRGIIVYVAWEPASQPERYVYLIADPKEVKVLRPC